jgi:hypothetical protein
MCAVSRAQQSFVILLLERNQRSPKSQPANAKQRNAACFSPPLLSCLNHTNPFAANGGEKNQTACTAGRKEKYLK